MHPSVPAGDFGFQGVVRGPSLSEIQFTSYVEGCVHVFLEGLWSSVL